MSFQKEKTIDLIRMLAGKFFAIESNRTSLITITNAAISDDGKKATIFFTVYPTDQEEKVLEFAKRKRSDFKAYVKEESRLGRIPFFDFAIDIGEKNRQRVEEIGFS